MKEKQATGNKLSEEQGNQIEQKNVDLLTRTKARTVAGGVVPEGDGGGQRSRPTTKLDPVWVSRILLDTPRR